MQGAVLAQQWHSARCDLGAELSFLGPAAFLMADQALSAAVSACYIPWERESWEDGLLPLRAQAEMISLLSGHCSFTARGFSRLGLTWAASQGKMARSSLLLPQVINLFVHRWPRRERALEVQEIRRKRSNKESLSCLDERMMKRSIFLMLGREGTFLSSKGQNSDLLCFCSILYIKFFNV